MAYDGALFGEGWKGSAQEGADKVKDMLRVAREDHGLLSLEDVVLNHTANTSEWLQDHPEAGYSPHNTPHLMPAFKLDNAILEFSKDVGSRGLPVRVTSQADVDALIAGLKQDVDALTMCQYYVLDVGKQRAAVASALSSGAGIPPWSGPDVQGRTVVELANILKSENHIQGLNTLGHRYSRIVDPKIAASLVKAAFVEVSDVEALADAWVRVVDVINVPLYEEWPVAGH